jgi:hypothetical protein
VCRCLDLNLQIRDHRNWSDPELRIHTWTLITSFDHVLLADVRRQDKAIATGVLTAEQLYRPREYVQTLGADAFEPACNGRLRCDSPRCLT